MKLARNVLAAAIVLVPISCLGWIASGRNVAAMTHVLRQPTQSDYDPGLASIISDADKVVFLGNAFDTARPVLTEIIDSAAIANFNAALQFAPTPLHQTGRCACLGFPHVEWFKDGKRTATASFHHGKSLRWSGSPNDERFAIEAQAWLKEFGDTHGIRMTR